MTFQVIPSSIKYLETSRGVAFTASIVGDGQPAGKIENRGDGGGTFCYYDSKETRDAIDAAAKAKFPNDPMAEEKYLDYLMDVAEGVVTA